MKSRARIQPRNAAAGLLLLFRSAPYSATELAEKKQAIWDSFDALKNGRGTEVDFENLDIAFATALERSRQIDELCVVTATVASDALRRTWERYLRLGRFGFDGPALEPIQDAIDLHDQLLELSTPKQMMDAARAGSRIGHVLGKTQ